MYTLLEAAPNSVDYARISTCARACEHECVCARVVNEASNEDGSEMLNKDGFLFLIVFNIKKVNLVEVWSKV